MHTIHVKYTNTIVVCLHTVYLTIWYISTKWVIFNQFVQWFILLFLHIYIVNLHDLQQWTVSPQFKFNARGKKMHRTLSNHKSASSPKGTPHATVKPGGGIKTSDWRINKDVQHLEDRNTGSKPVENEHSGSCGWRSIWESQLFTPERGVWVCDSS
jgi:hypothetical protein